ncbi:MAG: carboxypeptidase-like regulatory domain-containing protein [Pirellulaceae bacterium]|nr:carboxypeptidase-like regulatory domain-containing protein [Pirellulaceae bacterium]
MHARAPWWLLFVVLATLAGCGAPDFAEVTGKVTLDGEPLVFATVEFQPPGGSPAYGVTGDDGTYRLEWSATQSGVPIGQHRVRITSWRESKPKERERVPERYNKATELAREVKPGQQQIDFELTTN